MRSYLAKGKFAQSPCLECAGHNADKPFVCGSGAAAPDAAAVPRTQGHGQSHRDPQPSPPQPPPQGHGQQAQQESEAVTRQ